MANSDEGAVSAGVRVQWWPFMGNVEVADNRDNVLVKAMMRDVLSSWFRCEAQVFAPWWAEANRSLQGLHIKSHAAEFFSNVQLNSGRVHGPLSIRSDSMGLVSVGGIHCDGEVTIRSKDRGLVTLRIGAQGSLAASWAVQSLSSPVFVQSSSAIRVELGSSSTYSSLEAVEVRDDGSGFVLCSEEELQEQVPGRVPQKATPSHTSRRLRLKLSEQGAGTEKETYCQAKQSISFSSKADAGLHVRSPCGTCQARRWKHDVQLTASDKEALAGVKQLVQNAGRRPWMATIRVAGEEKIEKTWTVMSAPAFAYFDPVWLTVFSLGALAPQTSWQLLQLQGDLHKLAENVSDASALASSDSEDAYLLEAGHLEEECLDWGPAAWVAEQLRESLDGYNGPVYYKQSEGCRNGLVFQRTKKGLTVSWFPPNLPLPLLVALAFNVICACILAALTLKGIRSLVLPFISRKVAERGSVIDASQRLQNCGTMDELDIKADFSHYPERGINLTWRRTPEALHASFFRISCFCQDSQTRVTIDVPTSDLLQLVPKQCTYLLTLTRAGLEHVLDDVVTLLQAVGYLQLPAVDARSATAQETG